MHFRDSAFAVLHILSMPIIASETSNILFSLMPLRSFTWRLRGDGFWGDENKPDISSRPFSSRRPCGTVIPVRLPPCQRIINAILITKHTFQLCPQQRNHCCALGARLVEVPCWVEAIPMRTNTILKIGGDLYHNSKFRQGCNNFMIRAVTESSVFARLSTWMALKDDWQLDVVVRS